MSLFDAAIPGMDDALAATFGDPGYTVRVGTGSPHTVIVERSTGVAGEFAGSAYARVTVRTRVSEVRNVVGDVVVLVDALGEPTEAFVLDAELADDGHMRQFAVLPAALP